MKIAGPAGGLSSFWCSVATMDLLRQSSESLAGRIHYLHMSGMNVLDLPATDPKDIHNLWFRGGFPESYLASEDIKTT